MGCPILYTIHGKAICEVRASGPLADDSILLFQSTDSSAEAIERLKLYPFHENFQTSCFEIFAAEMRWINNIESPYASR